MFATRWSAAISAGCWWRPRNGVYAPSNSMIIGTACGTGSLRVFPPPNSGAMISNLPHGWRGSWHFSTNRVAVLTCPSMFEARRSSGGCGRRYKRFRRAQPPPMPKSPGRSAILWPLAPWPGRALQTRSLSSSPAIASSVATAVWAAIAGISSASKRCWNARPRNGKNRRIPERLRSQIFQPPPGA